MCENAHLSRTRSYRPLSVDICAYLSMKSERDSSASPLNDKLSFTVTIVCHSEQREESPFVIPSQTRCHACFVIPSNARNLYLIIPLPSRFFTSFRMTNQLPRLFCHFERSEGSPFVISRIFYPPSNLNNTFLQKKNGRYAINAIAVFCFGIRYSKDRII